MSFTETLVDLPLPADRLHRLQCYRWTERVETQRGRLGIHVDVLHTPHGKIGGSGHFYLSAGPYWPGTSAGILGGLRDSSNVSLALMVENLCYECLIRYVELCSWASVVSVTKSVAVMRGAFHPELLVTNNP